MNHDLFLAILALDSYNRGYNARTKLPGTGGLIGTASILTDSTDQLGEVSTQAAGFFALSYNWNGETIISIRGTDDLPDLIYGWITVTVLTVTEFC